MFLLCLFSTYIGGRLQVATGMSFTGAGHPQPEGAGRAETEQVCNDGPDLVNQERGEGGEEGPGEGQRLSPKPEPEPEIKSGRWPTSLRVRRQGLAMTAFLKATHAQTSCEAMTDVTPSFTDALEWIRSRKTDLDTALRLCHMYPNLIQEECLDGLWDFLLPFIQKGTKLSRCSTLDDSKLDGGLVSAGVPSTPVYVKGPRQNCKIYNCKHSQLKLEKKPNMGDNNVIVYVSFNNEEDSVSSTAARKLICNLTSYYYVRCSGTDPSPDSTASIKHANVFVFILNDSTLNNQNNINELMEALVRSVPLVILKDKTYQLPDSLPEHVQNFQIPRKDPAPRWIGKFVCLKPSNSLLPAENPGLPRLEIISPKSEENNQGCSDLSHVTTLKISSSDATHTETLEGVLRKLTPEYVEYDAHTPESGVKALRDKLSLYSGQELPDGGKKAKDQKRPSKCDNLRPPDSSPSRLSPTDSTLLSNMPTSLDDPGGAGFLPGIRRVHRSPSTHSAPETLRLPTPPSTPRPTSSSRRPSPTPPPGGLLPPITTSLGGTLRKHRSQEWPARQSPTINRRTTYMISSRPGTDPRLVKWPPDPADDPGEGLCVDSYGSVELPDFDSDSDTSICFGISSNDIGLSSSPSPDFV